MSTTPDPESISILLTRIHRGEPDATNAVDALIRRLEPEVQGWIRHERGKAIHAKYETVDLSQDFFVLFLKYLPNLKCENEATLRKLLYRMIQNMLRDRGAYLAREIRRISRERPLATDTVLELDPPGESVARPSEVIEQENEHALMRVGLALLQAEPRDLILRHHFDRESYVDIGTALGLEPDTVRMRSNRAMADLVKIVGRLRRGDIDRLLGEIP